MLHKPGYSGAAALAGWVLRLNEQGPQILLASVQPRVAIRAAAAEVAIQPAEGHSLMLSSAGSRLLRPRGGRLENQVTTVTQDLVVVAAIHLAVPRPQGSVSAVTTKPLRLVDFGAAGLESRTQRVLVQPRLQHQNLSLLLATGLWPQTLRPVVEQEILAGAHRQVMHLPAGLADDREQARRTWATAVVQASQGGLCSELAQREDGVCHQPPMVVLVVAMVGPGNQLGKQDNEATG